MAEESDIQWAIVEIMGHRRHIGRVTEEVRYGAAMMRIDVPRLNPERTLDEAADHVPDPGKYTWITHYYGGPSIFSITPTTEEEVMRQADGPRYPPPQVLTLRSDWHDEEED